MQSKLVVRSVAAMTVLVTVCLITSIARSEDEKKASNPAASDASAQTAKHQMPSADEMKKMMEKMQAAATPGPEHQRLADMVGTWDGEGRMFNPDGTPGTAAKGVMTCKVIFGGRYLQMEIDGTCDMGQGPQSYQAIGFEGYDNVLKKYVSTMMDNMGTGIMTSQGTADGSTVTMEGKCSCPMAEGECATKEVSTMSDKNHIKYEMWMSMGNGAPLAKCFEMNYTRKS